MTHYNTLPRFRFARFRPWIHIICFLLGSIGTCAAQNPSNDVKRTTRQKEYQKFLGQILSTNGSNMAPVPSFVLDASENPTLKLSLPIYGYTISDTTSTIGRNFLFFDGKVSSKNGYTPVISKGGWLPDVETGLSYTCLLNRNVWFYSNEISAASPLNTLPISKASRIFFGWFNLKGTYNYSKYTFYSDDARLTLAERLYSKEYNSLFIRGSFNEYLFFSRNYLFIPTVYFNVGYEFRGNDNNYLLLDEVNIRQTKVYTDTTSSVVEVLNNETKARIGSFVHGTSHTIPITLSLLFHNIDQSFYIGFSVYGQRRWINYTNEYKGSYDMGASINLPIQKVTDDGDKKTIANFTLRADIRDTGDDLVVNEQIKRTFKEKARLGFTLAVPVIPSHRGK